MHSPNLAIWLSGGSVVLARPGGIETLAPGRHMVTRGELDRIRAAGGTATITEIEPEKPAKKAAASAEQGKPRKR